jgi:hypothetical protein
MTKEDFLNKDKKLLVYFIKFDTNWIVHYFKNEMKLFISSLQANTNNHIRFNIFINVVR